MANYLVAYDLNRPGQNYADLIKHLESYPTHWHFQKSAWIVGPANSAYEVASAAEVFLDPNDLLVVTALTLDTAWTGYNKAGSDWIGSVAG